MVPEEKLVCDLLDLLLAKFETTSDDWFDAHRCDIEGRFVGNGCHLRPDLCEWGSAEGCGDFYFYAEAIRGDGVFLASGNWMPPGAGCASHPYCIEFDAEPFRAHLAGCGWEVRSLAEPDDLLADPVWGPRVDDLSCEGGNYELRKAG